MTTLVINNSKHTMLRGKKKLTLSNNLNLRSFRTFLVIPSFFISATTKIDWTSVEHGYKKTSVISIFPLRPGEMVLTPWHGDKKIEGDIEKEEIYKRTNKVTENKWKQDDDKYKVRPKNVIRRYNV